MSKVIDEQLRKNKAIQKEGFYCGKNGFDYVCIGKNDKIECSGNLEDMKRYAKKNNWAIGILVPVQFSQPEEIRDCPHCNGVGHTTKVLTQEEFEKKLKRNG